jgi:hypothetical protein
MTKFDVTLKSVLRDGKTQVLRALGIEGEYSELAPNLPSTRERRVDFLALVKAPRRRAYLAHVELQTSRDPMIADRMLNYMADIRHWQSATESRDLRGLNVVQTVVYVGAPRWTPKTEIAEENLTFRYRFVDAKSIDPAPLLESENLGDVTFAVLCRDGRRPDVIRKVLERIAAAPASERSDILTKLSVLSDLRGIGPRVQTEMERMGIPVNLEESTLVRATIDRVRQESAKKTSIENIVTVMRSRFQDKLPADLRERLESHTQDELNEIVERSLTAGSAEEALTKPTATDFGR